MIGGRALVAGFAVAACSGGGPAGDKPPGDSDSGVVDTGEFEDIPFVPSVDTTDNGDGTFTSIVSAIDEEEYVYFSFVEGGALVTEADEWDLKFRREVIAVNGGVSGTSDGEGAVLEAVAFAEIAYPPLAGWFTDLEDADADGRPDGPFAGWFDYDMSTHILTPKDQTYVVRHAGGAWRIRLDSYYWEDRSGWPTFTWAPLDDPGPLSVAGDALRVDATGDHVYVSLAEQMALAPEEPGSSAVWDVAFHGTDVETNGGVSGAGGRTAARVDGAFDAVTAAPPAGDFAEDAPDADSDGVPEYAIHDAFSVDPYTSEVVAVPDVTFVVARPDGTHTKLAFDGYADDLGTPGFPTFRLGDL